MRMSLPLAFIAPVDLYEPDVQAVINAIQSTGVTLSPVQKEACNNRILNLKKDEIWNDLIAYWGLLGGTAASHAINWRSPGVYNMTWTSNVTHSSNGVMSTTGGYGDTGYNASLGTLTTSTHFGFYSRTNSAADSADMGVIFGSNEWAPYSRWSDGNFYYGVPGATFGFAVSPGSDGPIRFAAAPGTNASFVMRHGAVVRQTTINPGSVKVINANLWVMGRNLGIAYPSARQYASFQLGVAPTQAQAIADSTSEQAYQFDLGRAV